MSDAERAANSEIEHQPNGWHEMTLQNSLVSKMLESFANLNNFKLLESLADKATEVYLDNHNADVGEQFINCLTSILHTMGNMLISQGNSPEAGKVMEFAFKRVLGLTFSVSPDTLLCFGQLYNKDICIDSLEKVVNAYILANDPESVIQVIIDFMKVCRRDRVNDFSYIIFKQIEKLRVDQAKELLASIMKIYNTKAQFYQIKNLLTKLKKESSSSRIKPMMMY